jgi:hypothetical protein
MLHVITYWKLLMREELCITSSLGWPGLQKEKKKAGAHGHEGPMGFMLMEKLIGVMLVEWIMEGR